MAPELKLGQELRLRQQLVMTPQLQQAIKILQLALPELEATVQAELEQNPMLEPLDRSTGESTGENGASDEAPNNGELPPDGERTGPDSDPESLTPELTLDNSMPSETMQPAESHDAAIEMKELGTVEKLDWQEYLE